MIHSINIHKTRTQAAFKAKQPIIFQTFKEDRMTGIQKNELILQAITDLSQEIAHTSGAENKPFHFVINTIPSVYTEKGKMKNKLVGNVCLVSGKDYKEYKKINRAPALRTAFLNDVQPDDVINIVLSPHCPVIKQVNVNTERDIRLENHYND